VASVCQREGRWYLKFKDASGRWVRQVSTAKTKTEARRLAEDQERKAERQRRGLEALPDDSGQTLAELCEWWLVNKCPTASAYIERGRLAKHVLSSAVGRLLARSVTSATIEKHLDAVEKTGAAPASLNHLRALLVSVFSRAIRTGEFSGVNPALTVERRKVPKRSYVTLREEEISAVLEEIPAAWRDLFATAIYTGMRKGELLGLRKSALDFEGKNILIAASYERETTKGGHADLIPMADAIVPILRRAASQSSSELVFPGPEGKMRKPSSAKLEVILRRALARAGLVEGYEHVCRRCKAEGKSHTERAADQGQRRCQRCRMLLWPRALHRPIRFHDLRHTAGTLMLRAGVDPHRVQRILRHSDVRTTTGIYGHLVVEDLRAAVNAIAPKAIPPEPPKEEPQVIAVAANSVPFGPPVVQGPKNGAQPPSRQLENRKRNRGPTQARDTGVEPVAFGSGGQRSIQLS